MPFTAPEWVWVPFEVDPRFDGYRVDRFLAQRLTAYSRNRVQKILEESRVLRADQPIKASARVRGGERILIAYPRRPEEPLPPEASLPVLYEDDALLVVNKPADLLSHPTDKIQHRTVLGVLRHSRPELGAIHLLHRLDRDTSGVLALAKNRAAARTWTETMERREIKKEYLAIVRGIPSPRRGVLDAPIGREGGEIKVRQWINVPGAVPAITRYEVLTAGLSHPPSAGPPSPGGGGKGGRSLPSPTGRGAGGEAAVRCFPQTGRLHQIRVHLSAAGHPILGDLLYTGDGALYLKMTRRQLVPADRERAGFPRLALHAARIVFPHPITGKTLRISAPLPEDLGRFLKAQGIRYT